MTDKKKNIHQRILDVMEEVSYIQKSDQKVNNQYSFVPHDKVAAVMHAAFVKHRIVCLPTVISSSQNGTMTSVEMEIFFVNPDDPSDKFSIVSIGKGIDGGFDKQGRPYVGDKGSGKAITYAYKYGLLKTFCLETGTNDDVERDPGAKQYLTNPSSPIAKSKLTEEQYKDLSFHLSHVPEFKKEIEEFYEKKGIKNLWEIPVESYEKIIKKAISQMNGE